MAAPVTFTLSQTLSTYCLACRLLWSPLKMSCKYIVWDWKEIVWMETEGRRGYKHRQKQTEWLRGVIIYNRCSQSSSSGVKVLPECFLFGLKDPQTTKLTLFLFDTSCTQIAVHKLVIATQRDFIISVAGWWGFTFQPSFSRACVEERSDNGSHFGPLWCSPRGIWSWHLLITASDSPEVHASLSCPV